MQLFALDSRHGLGEHIAAVLGVPLAEHEERRFEDGEHKARPMVGVRGEDVYVIESLYSDSAQSVHDRLCRLLFFLGAVVEGGAARVTAVMPYLAYARKDRQTKPRDPVTTRYMAQLIEAMGVDAVMALDVHNLAAFQNAFRCRAHALDTRRLFARQLAERLGDEPVVVVSPDPGGVKRARLFLEMLEAICGRACGFAFMDKRRSAGRVTGDLLIGDVSGAHVLIVDDLISTGHTMLRAAVACRDQGAVSVRGLAAHGLFTGDAASVVADRRIDGLMVTDTVPPFRLPDGPVSRRVEIVSSAPLFAEAIRRCHVNGSLVDLLEGPAA
ncbi:ribose-phosphate pyrophosphokinase [Spiribacter halobius]|uniref:ribose-phosphate diphosphokinase n=2 Tax=Sediminicurvatus halobius TaxID=2182432 RepID=A0A2U2N5E9_9GAMM|nr:ribose-phosphate pyrophosphokinase [Spiribacter halobius]